MDYQTQIDQAKVASQKWRKENPIVGVGRLRVDLMVDDLIKSITDLLARAEAAEARAEKAERERDAAVKTIFEWTGCPECKFWDSKENWCEKHDREADCNDGCSTPEWRGLKEE